MTSTFWINSYLRAALPAIGLTGFNAGMALNVTMGNFSSNLIVLFIFILAVSSKIAFAHLSSKESYLWFLGDAAKKSRFLIAHFKLVGVGVFLTTALMSVAQYGDLTTTCLSILVLSWILITEGYGFERSVKAHSTNTEE